MARSRHHSQASPGRLDFHVPVFGPVDPEGEEYGEERLSALARERRGIDAASLQEAILRDIETFEAGAAPTDDRTLVVLRRLGESA